jgi:hypothetical protein
MPMLNASAPGLASVGRLHSTALRAEAAEHAVESLQRRVAEAEAVAKAAAAAAEERCCKCALLIAEMNRIRLVLFDVNNRMFWTLFGSHTEYPHFRSGSATVALGMGDQTLVVRGVTVATARLATQRQCIAWSQLT